VIPHSPDKGSTPRSPQQDLLQYSQQDQQQLLLQMQLQIQNGSSPDSPGSPGSAGSPGYSFTPYGTEIGQVGQVEFSQSKQNNVSATAPQIGDELTQQQEREYQRLMETGTSQGLIEGVPDDQITINAQPPQDSPSFFLSGVQEPADGRSDPQMSKKNSVQPVYSNGQLAQKTPI